MNYEPNYEQEKTRIEEQLDDIKTLLTIELKSALTTDEAALYMGISSESVRRLCRQGKLTHYRPGGLRIYLKKEDLDKYITRNKVVGDIDLYDEVVFNY